MSVRIIIVATERGQNPTTSTAKGQPMRNKDTYFVSALKKLDSSSMDKLGPIPESSRGEGTGGQNKTKKNITRGNKQYNSIPTSTGKRLPKSTFLSHFDTRIPIRGT